MEAQTSHLKDLTNPHITLLCVTVVAPIAAMQTRCQRGIALMFGIVAQANTAPVASLCSLAAPTGLSRMAGAAIGVRRFNFGERDESHN